MYANKSVDALTAEFEARVQLDYYIVDNTHCSFELRYFIV